MGRIYSCLYILFLILVLTACGEDRSGEYYARTEEDRWIENKMQDIYLWYGNMPASSSLNYFAVPKDFFPTLLSKSDKYSYIETDNPEVTALAIDQSSSYGFDFILYNDPFGKTSNRYARVIFVLPHSPASEAGIKRGDWISGINGKALTNDNYGYLYRGEAREFSTSRVGMAKDSTFYWIPNETSILVQASRLVEDNPFYVDTIYNIEGKRIAYLMYNRFVSGNINDSTTYNKQMIRTMEKFKTAGIDELILDFRYNSGGELGCSQLMASLISPTDALNKIFCSVEYNNKLSSNNYELLLNSKLANGTNLNMKRLHILVSNLTQFAPEVLINCLNPYIGTENMILVGTKTNGQNVTTQTVGTPYNFILHPVVANVLNTEKTNNYSGGIKPKYILDETVYYDSLYALGNLNERMLRNTIELITTGKMSDGKADDTSNTRVTNQSRKTTIHKYKH